MKPGLSVDLREGGDGVPGYIPHHLFPAPDLDIGFYYEFSVSCFQESGEI